MQIGAISDTHGKHRQVIVQPGDVLLHAGDITIDGDKALIIDFIDWFVEQPFKHKIFIAGNHDRWAEQSHNELERAAHRAGVHYLCNSGVELDGIRFWGSPCTPEFMNWSFMLAPGRVAREHWQQVPGDVDVLLTHGPPAGILDEIELCAGSEGDAPTYSETDYSHTDFSDSRRETPNERCGVGCAELKNRIVEIDVPLHVFGHIHEGYGEQTSGNTHFINASLVNNRYQLINSPKSAVIEPRSGRSAVRSPATYA